MTWQCSWRCSAGIRPAPVASPFSPWPTGYAEKYPAEELVVKKYVGQEALEKYAEYDLSCVPAAVINGVIKIEGTAPDEGTMNNALREGGLWIR